MILRNKLNEFLSHGIIYTLSSVIQASAGFILLPFYGKYLSPSDFGVFSLIQMISVFFSTIFFFGVSTALTRSYYDYQKREERQKVFNTAFLLLIIGALSQVVVGLLFLDIIYNIIIKAEDSKYLLIINLAAFGIQFINVGFITYLRLLKKPKSLLIIVIFGLLSMLSSTYIFVSIHAYGLSGFIFAQFLSQFLTLVLFILYMKNRINLFNINKAEINIQLRFGIPVVLAGLSLAIINWGDRLILNNFLTLHDVGVYSMSFRIASVFNIVIAVPFEMVWKPTMMEYQKEKNADSLFSEITFYYVLISILFIFASSLFLEDVFRLFGLSSQYGESINYVHFLIFGFFITSLQSIFSAGLFYQRKIIMLTWIYLPCGVLSLLLSAFFINYYSIWGVVLSVIFSRLIIFIGVYTISKKYFHVKVKMIRFAKIFLSILVAMLMYKFLNIFLNGLTLKFCTYIGFLISVSLISLDAKERRYLSSEIKNNFR